MNYQLAGEGLSVVGKINPRRFIPDTLESLGTLLRISI
ncbi:MAG: hypothetical protein AB200_01885 [Parcubacteria bacterium C7867-005]|nr:MAG: hypothetical protein AB200_01885 [Parcubacteria bacterium C7867-005]